MKLEYYDLLAVTFGLIIGVALANIAYGHDNRISWDAVAGAESYLVTVQIDDGLTHWPVVETTETWADHINPPQFNRYCYTVWSLAEGCDPEPSPEKVCFIRTSSVEWPE